MTNTNQTTQNFKEKIQEQVKQEIVSGRFNGSYKLSEFGGEPHFEAGIDTKTLSEIEIKYNPAFAKTHNEEQILGIVKDITRHEINHRAYFGFHGCPRTLDNHVKSFIEPMSEILAPKGFGKNDFHYVANALEDTLLHADLNQKFALNGITSFFEDVAECSEQKLTPFYEAHTRLNMALWGNKKQKKNISRYFTQDKKSRKKVVKAVQGFLQESGIANLKSDEGRDRVLARDYINNPENWQVIAKAYARHFSPLMTPNYAQPLMNHSGEGTKRKQSKDKKSGKVKPNQTEKQGNEFDKEMETEGFKRKRIQDAYEGGEKAPAWMDSFESLDLLYSSLARKLDIKAKSYTEEHKKPIFHYGTREFDPERDNLKHVKFGFNEDTGKVELKKTRYHENMNIPYKKVPRGFPEAKFCLLDTSGSMQSGTDGSIGNDLIIPWGDKSKYHFALLGWYGFLEYLKENSLLLNMNISLGYFSKETKVAYGLENAKRAALSPNFGNNTQIDMEAVSGLFEGRGKLVFTLSDGEIGNWYKIKSDFIKRAKEHQYFHLQIGGKNSVTKEMERAGLKVEYIQRAGDLASRVIDLTDTLYRGKN